MEKELNIATILKEKPKGTTLWSDTFGELKFKDIDYRSNYSIKLQDMYANIIDLDKKGRFMSDDDNVLPCIVPSKGMRDWSKFAWKRGDVLTNNQFDFKVFFDKWGDDTYTWFYGKSEHLSNAHFDTVNYALVSEEVANSFIKIVEELHNGKFNLSTLEIEKQSEFKDGDIVVLDEIKEECYAKCIFALKNIQDDKLDYYALINIFNNDMLLNGTCFDKRTPRPATDSEKQQLFDALAKEGKVWDAEKKMLVDLPKKCEFKPMDWCLMKQTFSIWCLCQYAFKNDKYSSPYFAIGGNAYDECIPYNDQTAHLLGTTDEWKGGEG